MGKGVTKEGVQIDREKLQDEGPRLLAERWK